MSHTTLLTLDGLSCGHCVKRVKEALEQRQDVQQAEVSLNEARITGDAAPEALIATVEQAGYHASLPESTPPKPEPLSASAGQLTAENARPLIHSKAIPADKASQANAATTRSRPSADAETATDDAALPTQADTAAENYQLLIDGMSCASCVSRVEKALTQVAGVQQARVNLAERSALVIGAPQPDALVAAVEAAGYGAEVIVDESERREKQQRGAQQAMRRFSWQSALALALGVPLMIYGLFGDNMMLTASNRSGWLIVGVLTLLVMIVAGGHFYRSAWRSLRNGSATMDTLVALGTLAAWLYSISVNLWPDFFPMAARHLYYEASAMIIGLI